MATPNEVLPKYAALLTTTEVGLGSILHAWRLPFTGHFLSLNQGFILCKATQQASNSKIALQISMLTAMLKSLAPMGKRLTPMLAISMQGLLFTFGHWLLGGGYLGVLLGIMLLSLWTTAQPILIYFLIFGRDLFSAALYFTEQINKLVHIDRSYWPIAILAVALIHLILAAGVVWLSFSKKGTTYENYMANLAQKFPLNPIAITHPLTKSQKLKRVGHDLLQPWFLFSLILIGCFFWVTKSDFVQLIWYLLRTLSIAFLIFYALRFLPIERWLQKIFKEESPMGLALQRTLIYLKNPHHL